MEKINDNEVELAAFRKEIDAIDEKLVALLIERIGIVKRVGAYKQKNAPDKCPIRAGREAEMVRSIAAKFEGCGFSPAAAAGLWRIIIGASTAAESELSVSAFAPDKAHDLFWLAREYFGPGVPVLKQPHIKRVIGDVMDGKAAVGLIPLPRSSDSDHWWMNLLQQDEPPKIFAHVPFVFTEKPLQHAPCALAIANLAPESSGDDISLIVLETEHNISQHKLQQAFVTAKLEANWVSIATITPHTRHHLMEIKGFVDENNSSMKTLIAGLGASVIRVHYLGAYATPLVLKKETAHASKA